MGFRLMVLEVRASRAAESCRLGGLEAAADLKHFGKKCCNTWDEFCEALKRSAKPSSTSLNRPVGETGESRTLSTSLISKRVNHSWRSSTTRLAMDLLIT